MLAQNEITWKEYLLFLLVSRIQIHIDECKIKKTRSIYSEFFYYLDSNLLFDKFDSFNVATSSYLSKVYAVSKISY